jgi:hypothetical protein
VPLENSGIEPGFTRGVLVAGTPLEPDRIGCRKTFQLGIFHHRLSESGDDRTGRSRP